MGQVEGLLNREDRNVGIILERLLGPPRFQQYVACVTRLKTFAADLERTVGLVAVRWSLDQPGITVAMCGARQSSQIEESAQAAGWSLSPTDLADIDRIVAEAIPEPVGPEFMGPGQRK